MSPASTTVVVTGATSGIGRATALAFARNRARVIAVGRDGERGAALVTEIAASGGACRFIAADIAIEPEVEAVIRDTLDRDGRIDAVVNAAGVNPHAPLAQASAEMFDAIMGVNVRGLFHLLKHVIGPMGEQGGGAIVHVGSLGGERALAGKGLYCASKAAGAMLVRTAALEGGSRGVRVNEIAPGTVDTPMLRETWTRETGDAAAGFALMSVKVPLRRVAGPEEIAEAIRFLCSDAARYITGARLAVDGGLALAI